MPSAKAVVGKPLAGLPNGQFELAHLLQPLTLSLGFATPTQELEFESVD
jgi:hypothetical protein